MLPYGLYWLYLIFYRCSSIWGLDLGEAAPPWLAISWEQRAPLGMHCRSTTRHAPPSSISPTYTNIPCPKSCLGLGLSARNHPCRPESMRLFKLLNPKLTQVSTLTYPFLPAKPQKRLGCALPPSPMLPCRFAEPPISRDLWV